MSAIGQQELREEPGRASWSAYGLEEIPPEHPQAPYYRARYYDASSGRFISEDPIRFRGGINLYAYAQNRSTLLRDPSGRITWGGGVSGTLAGSAFWIGAGGEGSFYVVGDTLGNWGVLDCTGGGFGASKGAGLSAGVTGNSIVCPNCASICDMEGGFVGAAAFGGAGPGATVNGSASLGMKSATLTFGGGPAAAAGAGLVNIFGHCTLVWKSQPCPTCSSPKK